MKFKKLLVTGGSGFIGSNFIRHMLKAYPEQHIINLDKLTYAGNRENLKDIEHDTRYEFIKGDICDAALVQKLFRGANAVMHFAAESHVDRSIEDAAAFIQTNVHGTQVLLDAARKSRCELFLQVSTDEVYGSKAKGFSREYDLLEPNSPYAASKAAADLLCRSYIVTYKLPIIITRSSNNFGPYQYPEKIIPLFITNLLEDKKVPVYAEGKNIRDWIYVMDNCRGLDVVLQKGRPGEIYNIAANNQIRNLDLTNKILRLMGRKEHMIQFVQDRPGHDFRYALDTTKLRCLGWRPRLDFDSALAETVQWYRQNEKWWKPLEEKGRNV